MLSSCHASQWKLIDLLKERRSGGAWRSDKWECVCVFMKKCVTRMSILRSLVPWDFEGAWINEITGWFLSSQERLTIDSYFATAFYFISNLSWKWSNWFRSPKETAWLSLQTSKRLNNEYMLWRVYVDMYVWCCVRIIEVQKTKNRYFELHSWLRND